MSKNNRSIKLTRLLGVILPSGEKLAQNQGRLDNLLNIDAEDYGQIAPDELEHRIRSRIEEQDNIIYPQRLQEGRVTPEWRRYMKRREQAGKERL